LGATNGGLGLDQNPGLGPGPSGGHVQTDHGLHPSNRQRTVLHRDEAAPSERLGMVAESNSLHATGSACPLDTSNPLSTQTPGPVVKAGHEQHGAAVAVQF
jgi:hypothetical protein